MALPHCPTYAPLHVLISESSKCTVQR
jgi:hypothetical protein